MKALTLTQPWASLVMLGEKRIETRPVLFKHRGLLYIHASRVVDIDAFTREPFVSVLAAHGITSVDQVPTGKVLGSVYVVDGCRFTDWAFPDCVPDDWPRIARYERDFGDFRAGRGGLLLAQAKPFAVPIPARGMNGLWNWDQPAEAPVETETR